MRPITPNDTSWILDHYRDRSNSSFVVLASFFGFSESELKASTFRSSSIYIQHGNEGSLLLSVHDLELDIGTARIQLCAESGCAVLDNPLRRFMESHEIHRLISYVFPGEELEMKILTELGFVREAVFREHIFINGAYQDILVYGLVEEQR